MVKLTTTEAIGKKETRVTKAQAAILLIQKDKDYLKVKIDGMPIKGRLVISKGSL